MIPLPIVFRGAVINPQTLTSYDALPNCLLAVSPTGDIEWIVENVVDSMVQEIMSQKGCPETEVVTLKNGEFIMPGFIDTHTHAPQVPNLGIGGQYQLLDWLENCTFPMESKFADVEFARRTYRSVARRIIDYGTTTCCYYGTLHLEATKVLADIVHEYGQRAFVGKCNMIRHCPAHYIEPSAQESLAATETLVNYIRSLSHSSIISDTVTRQSASEPLVQPIITPRFAISCTSELLTSLGILAASDPTLRIQTHISENPKEVALTKELYPNSDTYAAVYDDHGLLRENTILAHAVHLEVAEMELIAKRKAGVSHCPTSNFHLSSGVASVGEYLDRGIKVGLGTDVSGGFSPSILSAIQHASIASKVKGFNPTPNPPKSVHAVPFTDQQLSVATLLYLATLGGAQLCCLDHQVGSFIAGKSFDALIVNVKDDAGNPALWGEVDSLAMSAQTNLEGMLERFLFCGDDRNISRVYVQGRFIGGKEFRKLDINQKLL